MVRVRMNMFKFFSSLFQDKAAQPHQVQLHYKHSDDAIKERQEIEDMLLITGGWISISNRFVRQGLEGIFIKYNDNAVPICIIVTKSERGMQKLEKLAEWGIPEEMRPTDWSRKRESLISELYNSASKAKKVIIREKPVFAKHVIPVMDPDGVTVYFWRETKHKPWKFTGKESQIKQISQKLDSTSKILDLSKMGCKAIRYDSLVELKEKIKGIVKKMMRKRAR